MLAFRFATISANRNYYEFQTFQQYFHFYRDLRETRQRFDSVGGEIKRKDNQIRELQQRLDVNEGCKWHILIIIFDMHWFRVFFKRF